MDRHDFNDNNQRIATQQLALDGNMAVVVTGVLLLYSTPKKPKLTSKDDPFRNLMYVTKLLKHCHEFLNTAASILLSMLWFFHRPSKGETCTKTIERMTSNCVWGGATWTDSAFIIRLLLLIIYVTRGWQGEIPPPTPLDILQSINLLCRIWVSQSGLNANYRSIIICYPQCLLPMSYDASFLIRELIIMSHSVCL